MAVKPRDMQVNEILTELSNLKSDELKIQTLSQKYYDHTPLHRILKMNYCNTISPMLPEGTPPFNRNEEPDGPNHASLWEYLRIFPVIVRSTQSLNMRPLQIERMFIEMLEAVDPQEAEIVCLAKDKNLESKYQINVDIVNSAFPQLKITAGDSKPVTKTNEELAEEYLEMANLRKKEAKKLNEEAKDLIKKAKELANEDA